MAEQPGSPLLDKVFDEFRDEVLRRIEPAGPDAVRATVRRRRRRTTVVSTTVALTLAVVPVAAYATLSDRVHRPPSETATAPSPPEATAAPSGPVTVAPTESETRPGGHPTPPDGRLTRGELLRTRVDLPAWPGVACPVRQTRLADRPVNDGDAWVAAVDYGDVDSDGAAETLVLVRCLLGHDSGPAQVVALDRDPAGQIVTLGQVVSSDTDGPGWLLDVEAGSDGSVRVEVADVAPGDGWPLEWSQRQWRTYRWDGDSFRQQDGPTDFPDNPRQVDISVTAADVTFSERARDEPGQGTVTVHVRNRGPVGASGVLLRLDLGKVLVRPEGPGWSACTSVDGSPSSVLTCLLGPLPSEGERELTLGLTLAAGAVLPDAEEATVSAYALAADSAGEVLPEVNEKNNRDSFTLG